MRRGQVLRRAYRLAPVLHRSQGALDASRRRRRGFSVGGLSRAAVKRLWTFSSRRKNRRSASTAPASRHAASSMKSDRFFPSASAARSIRARCLRFARRLIVTSRPCRSCLSVLAMGSPLVSTTSYNRVLTLSTQDPGRLHLAAPVIGWQNLDRCSRALWNRTRCDLENDEMLAQTLNRGEIEVWRDVYRRAKRRTSASAHCADR